MEIEEARRRMLRDAERGTRCPCCGRLVKLYKRRFHAEMGRFLIMLVKAHEKEARFYGLRDLRRGGAKASTDGSYLRHWGLVEHRGNEYAPTKDGIDFVRGKLLVPSHVFLLNNEVQGYSDESVDIRSVLGTRFNYEELMMHRKDQITIPSLGGG